MAFRNILSLILLLMAIPGFAAEKEPGPSSAENEKSKIENEKIIAAEKDKIKKESEQIRATGTDKSTIKNGKTTVSEVTASENSKLNKESEQIGNTNSSANANANASSNTQKTSTEENVKKTNERTIIESKKITVEQKPINPDTKEASFPSVSTNKSENTNPKSSNAVKNKNEKTTIETQKITIETPKETNKEANKENAKNVSKGEKKIVENGKLITENGKTTTQTEKTTTDENGKTTTQTEKTMTDEDGKTIVEGGDKIDPATGREEIPENKKLILHGDELVSYPIPCPIQSKDKTPGYYPKACPCEDLLHIYFLAADYDPTLQTARAQQLATGEAYPQARALMLPLLNAIADYTTNKYTIAGVNSFTSSNYTLNLSQPIMNFEQWANLDRATDIVKQANAIYIAAEQDLMIRTAVAYFNVLKSTDSLYYAQAQEKAFLKFQDQTYQRFKVGLIPITDYEISKARHDNALALVISTQTELQDNVDKLREIICIRPHKLAPLKTKIPLITPEPQNMEEWVDTAIKQNFTLLAAYYNAEAARNNIRVNKYQHLPVLDVHGEYDINSASPLISNKAYKAGILGTRITLPLIAGGSVLSKTREARFNYQKADSQFETEFRTVESSTRQAYRGVITQIDQIRALEQAVISNQSALDATEAAFNVGTRTIVDVLNAQSDLIRAQKDYSDARNNYVVEILKLKQAAGTLCVDDIIKINEWLKCST